MSHFNLKTLESISKYDSVENFGEIVSHYDLCPSCNLGKQSKNPFPKTFEKGHKSTWLLHSNICGPMSTKFPIGNLYFVLFINDINIMTWVYFLRQKLEAFNVFKNFKRIIEVQIGQKISVPQLIMEVNTPQINLNNFVMNLALYINSQYITHHKKIVPPREKIGQNIWCLKKSCQTTFGVKLLTKLFIYWKIDNYSSWGNDSIWGLIRTKTIFFSIWKYLGVFAFSMFIEQNEQNLMKKHKEFFLVTLLNEKDTGFWYFWRKNGFNHRCVMKKPIEILNLKRIVWGWQWYLYHLFYFIWSGGH